MCPAGSLRSLAFNDQLLFSLAAPLSDQLLFEMEGAADLTSLPREFHHEFPPDFVQSFAKSISRASSRAPSRASPRASPRASSRASSRASPRAWCPTARSYQRAKGQALKTPPCSIKSTKALNLQFNITPGRMASVSPSPTPSLLPMLLFCVLCNRQLFLHLLGRCCEVAAVTGFGCTHNVLSITC